MAASSDSQPCLELKPGSLKLVNIPEARSQIWNYKKEPLMYSHVKPILQRDVGAVAHFYLMAETHQVDIKGLMLKNAVTSLQVAFI